MSFCISYKNILQLSVGFNTLNYNNFENAITIKPKNNDSYSSDGFEEFSVTFSVPNDIDKLQPSILINTNSGVVTDIIYKWVKLEIGDFATPYIEPDEITELIKCKKYYDFIKYSVRSITYNSTGLNFIYPHNMRIRPTIFIDYNTTSDILGKLDLSGFVKVSNITCTSFDSYINILCQTTTITDGYFRAHTFPIILDAEIY